MDKLDASFLSSSLSLTPLSLLLNQLSSLLNRILSLANNGNQSVFECVSNESNDDKETK